MKKIAALALILAATTVAALAAGPAPLPVGRVEYAEGSVILQREGASSEADIDDLILPGDLVKTGADGRLVIALDKSTGMSGTVSVRPRSAFYVRADKVKGESKTTIELLAGSVGSKLSKLAGKPMLQVTTQAAIMGVRGTRFEIAAAVTEAVLVACDEGEVWVTDGRQELPVPAGQAVEKREGQAFRKVPVAISSAEEFRAGWVAAEVEAFRAAPVKALASFERRYADLAARFEKAYAKLAASSALKKWLEEDKAGLVPRALDPAVMREKKELVGLVQELRGVLFMFERVYYRGEEIAALVAGGPYERSELRKGYTAADFLARLAAEREGLARKTALYRTAERLYALRNEGVVPGQATPFGL